MAGDYLIGYEPWDSEPLGLIADTGWLIIADWRIAVSNILGAIAVPLYFIAAKEFINILISGSRGGANLYRLISYRTAGGSNIQSRKMEDRDDDVKM